MDLRALGVGRRDPNTSPGAPGAPGTPGASKQQTISVDLPLTQVPHGSIQLDFITKASTKLFG